MSPERPIWGRVRLSAKSPLKQIFSKRLSVSERQHCANTPQRTISDHADGCGQCCGRQILGVQTCS